MPEEAEIPTQTTSELWVLGNFSMSGATITRHAAEIVASALAGGQSVRTLSFHAGAFAEKDVTQMPARGPGDPPRFGIVYLRTLTRLAGSGRRLAIWRKRWRALRALIRTSDTVILLHETRHMSWRTGRLQWALGRLLAAIARNSHMRLATDAPVEILLRDLGLQAEPVSPRDAEARLLTQIQTTGGVDLRITDAHVMRALRHPDHVGIPIAVREDIRALAAAARRLTPKQIETAIRHGQARGADATPRAFRVAFAPDENAPDLPRIAAHLRSVGKSRRFWSRYLPPAQPGTWNGRSRNAIVLRRLAGVSESGDVAELTALNEPLFPEGSPLTRLEWFLMVGLRSAVPDLNSLLAPWASEQMIASLEHAVPGLAGSQAVAEAKIPELRITGIAGNGTGLAQNFWMSAQAMGRAGLVPVLAPLDSLLRTAPPDATLAQSGPHLRLTRSVTLYHANADRIPQEILASDPRLDPYTIGYLLWELDRIPAQHKLALDMLDEIWVPSIFLQRLYQKAFDREVVLMRKAIELPEPRMAAAAPEATTRFLVTFDQRSSISRKNPLAALRAFQAAFGGRSDVELIIKTTPEPGADWSDATGQMWEIETAADADPRVKLIKAHLPLPDLLGLIASADALLSPHRAEGFGYFPAFALALGVPVVATDYSGTRDFCTPETSFPVPARMIPVGSSEMPFCPPKAKWADIIHDAFVEALREVASNPAAARARAERGQAIISTDYAPSALARRYADRLVRLGLAERTSTPAQGGRSEQA